MSAVNQVWPCKRSIWSEVTRWQLQTFVNLLFNCQPLSIPPHTSLILPVCLCLTVSQQQREQPACRKLYHQTCSPCSAFPSSDGQSGNEARKSDGCDEEGRRKRRNESYSISFSKPGWGSASLAIRGNLFKGERLLTICLPMREQRQGRQSFLPPLQQRQREK